MNNAIELKWFLLGAQLAVLSENEQVDFFTGFAKELMTLDTNMSREIQLLSVRDKLRPEIRKILKDFFPCMWYDEKTPYVT